MVSAAAGALCSVAVAWVLALGSDAPRAGTWPTLDASAGKVIGERLVMTDDCEVQIGAGYRSLFA